MNRRSRLSALAAALILLNLGSAWAAETEFRLIPVVRLNEFYDDNVELRNTNIIRDFITYLFLGGYLGFYSEARHGDLQYYTVGELFAHHGSFSQFGNGQYARFLDRENLSHVTKLSLSDSFLYGNAARTGLLNQTAITTQGAFSLLNNTSTISNFFASRLRHDISDWNTYLTYRNRYFNNRGGRTTVEDEGTLRADYGTSKEFRAGGSFDLRDFRFSDLAPVQTYWPQALMTWNPSRPWGFFGSVGPIFINQFGQPGIVTKIGFRLAGRYDTPRWKLAITGGQRPGATAGLGGAGLNQSARGRALYEYSRNLNFFAFGSYFQATGGGANGRLVSYGGGGTYRLNKWFSVYAQYLGRERTTNQVTNISLGPGVTLGQTAVGNIYLVGMSASVDVYDWSM